MEMERINDDTIRVVVTNDDLAERSISIVDLLGNQDEIEEFFYSILEEVDVDGDFEDNEAVTFQVLPNRNGLELFISKNIDDKTMMEGMLNSVLGKRDAGESNDDVSDDLLDKLLASDSKDSQNVADQSIIKQSQMKDVSTSDKQNHLVDRLLTSENINDQELVLQFDDFENIIQFSLMMQKQDFAFSTKLVKYHSKFYYILGIDGQALQSNYDIKDLTGVAREFAKVSEVSAEVLVEHGQIVFNDNALEQVLSYFK
ncbi:adaptor protein MecA [Weissella paramesenteroides]|uniref:adaptor protein MecA n=1 Tax=Weissella paramesenteroides TaxID=1249 RepID=UPI00123C5333|nr:adaptor protein MecA [Weissella paramesenteroides]KAA8445056.1 competence protein [Weissella paramesenteroides]KAA8452608.1 competence protein [Weissella paramesenteroides]